jgi:2-polyprenyl-3-methyl-5-hydroxy-6-metoxy-1,4-benzoquinol methylase
MTADPPGDNYHGAIRRDIIPLVADGERLLDVGGGYGATAAELKRLGRCRFAGVIDRVAPARHDGLDFSDQGDLAVPGELTRKAAAHGPFDTILCLDVLEHLIAPDRLLEEAMHLLRPGGQLIVSIPNVRHVSVVLPLLRGHWDYADTGVLDRTHLRFYVRRTAVALIEAAGFSVERVVASNTQTRTQRLLNLATLGLLRDLFTVQYFIVARSGRVE